MIPIPPLPSPSQFLTEQQILVILTHYIQAFETQNTEKCMMLYCSYKNISFLIPEQTYQTRFYTIEYTNGNTTFQFRRFVKMGNISSNL